MKKIFRIVSGVLLAITFWCTSITDVSAEGVESTRSGYHSGDVYLNGKRYSYDTYFQMDGKGIRSMISTSAYIARTHENITVQFNTNNYGYNTVTGGYSYWSSYSGVSYSGTVHCSYGDSQVISYIYMHGYVRLHGDSQVNYHLSA